MPVYDPSNCSTLITYYYRNYELNLQPNLPICYVPPECDLTITNTETTPCSERGSDDGTLSVTATTSNATSLKWYLSGQYFPAKTGMTATFTGLKAGFYSVMADDDVCHNTVRDIQVVDGEFKTGDIRVVEPASLTAAENPIIYELYSADSGAGQKAEATIEIVSGATISDGDSITFNLESPYEYSQTFYAKGFPNQSNWFLASILVNDNGIGAGTSNSQEIAQSLADALQQDTLIPKVYQVSYDGLYTINLRAKETGSKYSINNNNIISSTNDFTVTQIKEGKNDYDGQQLDNYSLYCEIFLSDDNNQYPTIGELSNYKRVSEVELPFQRNNIHRFNVTPILKNYVYSTRPDFNQTGSTIQSNMIKPYYLRYGEKYALINNTNTKKKRYKGATDVKWFINSALDHFSTNDIQQQGYLGERLHDIKGNFGGTFEKLSSTECTLTIDDYLYQSGNTENIMFKFVETNTSTDTGWQTNNYVTLTGSTEFEGTVYISGSTDGAIVTYQKDFTIILTFHIYWLRGYSSAPEPISNVKFLTNSPEVKSIQRESQEYLGFILQSEYNAELDVRGDLYFYDGSTVTGETFFTIQSATGNSAGGVMLLNLSYNKLGLESYEQSGSVNRKIKRADFAVYQTDSNGTYKYTENKSFRFEIEDRPRKYGIVFQNTLGSWDSFDFVGIVEQTIDRDYDTYTLPINFNKDGSTSQGFKSTAVYNTKITKEITVNSGWIDEEHFDWLRELMSSNEIYSYTTDDQNYLILDKFKYNKSSLDDLFEIEATFIATIYENNVSV